MWVGRVCVAASFFIVFLYAREIELSLSFVDVVESPLSKVVRHTHTHTHTPHTHTTHTHTHTYAHTYAHTHAVNQVKLCDKGSVTRGVFCFVPKGPIAVLSSPLSLKNYSPILSLWKFCTGKHARWCLR